MEELTKTEERIMQVLWKLKTAFVKDMIDQLHEEPKPPYNTISSIVRILVKKGFISYKAYGKTYEYFQPSAKKNTLKQRFQKYLPDTLIILQLTFFLSWLKNRN